MYGLRSKLVSMFAQASVFVKTSVFLNDKRKALACSKIWPFFVNYKSVKFYSTGPRLGMGMVFYTNLAYVNV